MTERVKRLLDSMRLGEHEGVVVYDPSNMFYLSGYTGEGLVLVARGISAIITDFRYTEQAQAQAPGFEVLMTEKGKSHEDIAGALCASGGIDTLYYEDDFVTVHTFNALRESVRGVEWKVVGSEIARLREIKDEDELALIREACRITGEAFERILPHIKEGVTEKAQALYETIKAAGIRAKIDLSDNSLGWKCAQYEMKGVPVRVELGPKDIENGVCMAVRRDNGEKIAVKLEEVAQRLPEILDAVQKGLYDKAKRNLDEHTYVAHSIEEAKELQEKHGGFIKTMWCGDLQCELDMKEKAGMSSRCIPFQQEKLDEVCACCGKPAKTMIYWGVAY